MSTLDRTELRDATHAELIDEPDAVLEKLATDLDWPATWSTRQLAIYELGLRRGEGF